MKILLAVLFVLGALLVGSAATGGAASAGFGTASYIGHFGPGPATAATKAASATGTFGCGPISCAAYEAGVNGYVQDVAAASGSSTNVYSVATEYYDTTGPIAYTDSFGGTFEDTHRFPTNGCSPGAAGACLTESQLVAEIQRDMTANGWTASGNNLFAIFLPSNVDTCDDSGSQCASNTFCAYHDFAAGLIFAVEPFNADFGCDGSTEPSNPQGFPNGQAIDETVNTLSHETNEAVTDPQAGNGWTSARGSENGDLCAWWFGSPLGTSGVQPYNQVINGHDYSLQQEFSNSANFNAGGCRQHAGGTASSVSPYAGDNGPLIYGNGPVMRSANVYTIYWVPAPLQPPVNNDPPVVSGAAGVGRQLSTTTGTWANLPTTYTYRWQRCDNTGSNCVAISTASGSAYTLVSADAGHEIRSEVKATNSAGGSAWAPSLPTAVVVAKPTVITRPVLSGTAQVGQILSTDTGTWTNSPTSYAYHWLRCGASGGSCVAITGATSSTYTLKSKDVGHTLKAKVTAKNAAGATSVLTAKSAVVTN